MHILLIDDNKDTRQLFSMAFVLAGYRVSSASCGAEAVEFVAKRRFDAVLLDIEMPEVNGWEVLESIRALPNGERVPVILFSAFHDESKEKRAKEAGAYMLLRKPMLPEHVVAIVAGAINDRSS